MVPPAFGCFRCGSADVESTSVVATGNLYTFTKIWIAPAGREADAPYTVAVVELAGGLLLPARIVKGQDDDLAIGQPLTLVDRDEYGYIFAPAE